MMRQPGLSAESQRWEMQGAVWIAISLLLLVPKKTRRIGCMGAAGACAVAAFQQYAVETSDCQKQILMTASAV